MIFGGAHVLRGIFRLATGRAAGIADFGNTIDSYYASLAPLIAFVLVDAGLLAYYGQPREGAVSFVSQLSMMLIPSVATYEFARWMKREDSWLRTAAALNWSFWVTVPVLFVAALSGGLMVNAGIPERTVETVMLGLIAAYLFWYHWFTVRSGLRLSTLQALGLVLATNIVLGIVALGPYMLDYVFGGHPSL